MRIIQKKRKVWKTVLAGVWMCVFFVSYEDYFITYIGPMIWL